MRGPTAPAHRLVEHMTMADAARRRGRNHVHGPDGVRFYTRAKVVTQRWPELERDASFDMPTAR